MLVAGDVKIDFYHKDLNTHMFSFSFNTSLETIPSTGGVKKIVLPLADLDAEKAKKHFTKGFTFELYFLDGEQVALSRSEGLRIQQNANKGSAPAARTVSGLRPRNFGDTLRRESRRELATSRFFTLELPPPPANPCPVCLKTIKAEEMSLEVPPTVPSLSTLIPLRSFSAP